MSGNLCGLYVEDWTILVCGTPPSTVGRSEAMKQDAPTVTAG
ncbi:hypothetical protein [Sulfodiicoccus acidiphilus]|nr:hypothetical protein [Sulfodiicoccus acidiphilus]